MAIPKSVRLNETTLPVDIVVDDPQESCWRSIILFQSRKEEQTNRRI